MPDDLPAALFHACDFAAVAFWPGIASRPPAPTGRTCGASGSGALTTNLHPSGEAAAPGAVPAGPGPARLRTSNRQPPPVDRRRPVQVRSHRRTPRRQPHAGTDPAACPLGEPAPDRPAPAGVRRRAQPRPAAQRHRPRAGRAARNAGATRTETCNAQITDLHYVGGDEALHVLGKGAKPAEISLPIPVLRAVRAATDGRTTGPVLQSAKGQAFTRGAASRLLARVVGQAGISHPVSPHTLRRTFCTAGLSAASRSATCSTPCATQTPAPPSAATWPAPTSTATPPTASPPTSPAWPSADQSAVPRCQLTAAIRHYRSLSGCVKRQGRSD